MNKSLLLLPFIALCAFANAQSGAKPQVTVIGTVHTGNKSFNHRTLLAELERRNPDLILWEYHEPFKRVFGLGTARFLRIAKPSIEQSALQTFSRRHPQVPLLGFDTLILQRKAYLKTLYANLNAVYGALHEAATAGRMQAADSSAYFNWLIQHKRFEDFTDTADLATLNGAETVALSKSLKTVEANVLLALAEKYVADTAAVRWVAQDQMFWLARNRHMAERILAYAKQHPGKRITVLTGLHHKYFLDEVLNRQNP